MPIQRRETTANKQYKKNYCIDFHGATFINRVGQEIPITEEMVEDACEQYLSQDAMMPQLAHSA
ncbi:MAG: hypothetical protein GY694_09625 [Gammaproteobacteria bacterium]|nr:hypothetical protein [Gammaproteobacteria bacterium]